MTNKYLLGVVLAVQVISAVFFLSENLSSILGLRDTPIAWQVREMMELGAALGLVLGTVLGAVAMARTIRRTKRIEDQLRVASGAFADLLNERFLHWGLTPAERDVAWFSVKGMSTSEIAELRSTSEGTVKAQSNAIYRKAGVNGRYQLLSVFIDELMAEASLIKDDRDIGTAVGAIGK
ncbi:MAG: helix-turn-helix transcriptional regulator [Paracoccaceae bacterium]